MKAVTGQSKSPNADRKTVETAQELMALYKKEFGADWRNVFSATVRISVAGS